jgi:hypothetical protein
MALVQAIGIVARPSTLSLEELRKAEELKGVALNQLINVAVAEKISALRTVEYFQERGRRANRAETFADSRTRRKRESSCGRRRTPTGGAEETAPKRGERERFGQ